MNETKVYIADTADLKNEMLFKKLYHTVSSERRAKIDRYLFEKDKRLSLAAELLLKKGLQDAGLDKYRLRYGRGGKPCIEGQSNRYFNLSHSEERAMCVISSREVGCDVEKVQEIELEVARRFFCEEEYEKITEQETVFQRYDIFFRIWTLKESFMKATGLGMALPPDTFQIAMHSDIITVKQTISRENWNFREYDFKDGYKYAVCGMDSRFAEAEWVSFSRETDLAAE